MTELSKGGRAVDEVAGSGLVRTVAFPLSEVGGQCSDSQEQKQGEPRRAAALVQAWITVVAVRRSQVGFGCSWKVAAQHRLTDRCVQ